MNDLLDKLLSKVDRVAARPGRVMAILDVLLSRITPKDIASAACPTWTETCSYCTINSCAAWQKRGLTVNGTRKCWFQSSACNIKVCNACSGGQYKGCFC